jgi:hypothetical protein
LHAVSADGFRGTGDDGFTRQSMLFVRFGLVPDVTLPVFVIPAKIPGAISGQRPQSMQVSSL